ncbi:hypothetical protein Bbelb_120560 [Branchiostoma belcheri]|nr:hypothetical protein Bbelb_120560 [Branchiostoma belcheri]
MKAERYQQAVDSYTSAITVNSNNAVYYCNRAAAYSKLLDHQKSLEDCQKAVEIDPTYSKAYGRLGMAYSNLNQHEKAKQSYQQALELDPDNQTYQSNLRLAEQKLREINLGGPGMGGPGLGGMGGIPGGLGGLGGMGGAGLGGMDLGGLLNNPMLMNMATQMMQNPQMQQMLGNLLGSGGAPTQAPSSGEAPAGPGGLNMSEFLQAGQQMAQQIQQQNPELVEQLRTQMGRDPPDGSQDNPDGKPGSAWRWLMDTPLADGYCLATVGSVWRWLMDTPLADGYCLATVGSAWRWLMDTPLANGYCLATNPTDAARPAREYVAASVAGRIKYGTGLAPGSGPGFKAARRQSNGLRHAAPYNTLAGQIDACMPTTNRPSPRY